MTARRPGSEIVQVKARMREDLRRKLEREAASRGLTVNAEILRRLESSFTEQTALGGPELQNIAHIMAATFAHSGTMQAVAEGHPDWTPHEWLLHQTCYREAMVSVMIALLEFLPDKSPHEVKLLIEALEGRAMSRLAN